MRKTTIILLLYLFTSLYFATAQNIDSIPFEKFITYSDEAFCKHLIAINSNNTLSLLKKSEERLAKLRIYAVAKNDKKLLYYLNLIEAIRLFQEHVFHSAIPRFQNALEETGLVTTADSTKILVQLKICFLKLNNCSKAYEIHQHLCKHIILHPNLKNKYLGPPLSHIYYEMGLYKDAIKELNKEHTTDKYSSNKEANYFNNLGVIWQRKPNPDSAIYYFLKAKIIVDTLLKTGSDLKHNLFFSGLVDGNIGQALLQKKEYKKAIPLLLKDIHFSTNYNNLENAAVSHNDVAKCYYALKEYGNAEKHLDSAYSILKNIEEMNAFLSNIKLRAELFNATQRTNKAIIEYSTYIRLTDSIRNVEKELQLLNQQVAYSLMQKENLIDEKVKVVLKEKEKTVKQQNQNNLLMLLTFTLFIISLLIFYFYRMARNREIILIEKNKEITEKNILINETLNENEVLIREVHHRVKNNMQIISSLLNLQADKIEDENVKQNFYEARERIQSMALIHEFLYRKEKMVSLPMREYIDNLTKEIARSYSKPDKKISIESTCDDIYLNLDTAIPLGLVLNELITNVFKHAFVNLSEGKIMIRLTKNQATILLEVADNGMGLPEDFDSRKNKSLGMELIEILGNQLGAKIEFVTNNGLTTKVTFHSI